MVRVPEGEVQRHWGKIPDLIASEPLTVTSNGKDQMVIMSPAEYNRLTRDRRVMTLADFTVEDIEAIRKVTPSPEAEAFNHEVRE